MLPRLGATALGTLTAGALGLGTITTAAPTAVASSPSKAAEVEAYLRERMAATDTPGLAYAIVSSESIEQVGTVGHDGAGSAITPSTPFLWGSVAKPVTATTVMTLVEAGTVDLDAPVRTYLPEFTLADADSSERITVGDLLAQTSGIPDGTDATDRFDEREEPYEEAVAELADVEPLFPPGERHEYSSANYLVLGAVVEAVTGQDFTDYLHAHVLDPLGMTGVVTTPEDAAARVPDGHAYAFGRPITVTSHYDVAGPSYGYLGGTVEDLARFTMDQLAGHHGGSRVVGPDSIADLHAGTAAVSDGHDYALGWRVDDRNSDLGTTTIWHGGGAQGYQAMTVLLPELDLGLVVLQNIYGIFQDGELAGTGLEAARVLAGGTPEPVGSDPSYGVALGALGAVLLAVATALGWAIHLLLRSRAVRVSGAGVPRGGDRAARGGREPPFGAALCAGRRLDADRGHRRGVGAGRGPLDPRRHPAAPPVGRCRAASAAQPVTLARTAVRKTAAGSPAAGGSISPSCNDTRPCTFAHSAVAIDSGAGESGNAPEMTARRTASSSGSNVRAPARAALGPTSDGRTSSPNMIR
nr:serine hydrolase domain-containing protein [Jiangella asiatica]